MSDRRRPVHISDLLWLTAFVALVMGFVLPAYRLSSDAHYYAARLSPDLLGPLAVSATLGILLVPASHLWLGVLIMRSKSSMVTRGLGIAILFNAIPSGFASALIAKACASQMAG